MAFSRLVLTVNTSLPVGTLQNILNDSTTRKLPYARKVINFFRALSAGARSASVLSGVVDSGAGNAVAAFQTATFSGAATAADTVTINGAVLTAVANVATPTNNQWRVGTDATTAAANLAAAINASTTDALSGTVKATSSGAVCTVTCLIPGVIGNALAISKSATAITLGGATLASGTGKLPVLATFSFGY